VVDNLAEIDQVVRILSAFFTALVIIYVIAKFVGEERKILWFKKRTRSTIFTRRSILGETWHFGVPCKWQGFVVSFLMFGIIGVVSYIMIFTV
jgi:phage shock protein PspC (stress-responsive transcriptional regulator)